MATTPNFSNSVPVEVNFNVLVEANGEINVFSQGIDPSVTNPIIAAVNLPVNALYDASGASYTSGVVNSLFEFWEPEDAGALGERRASLCTSLHPDAVGPRDYTKMSKKLVRDLQTVLEGPFDCSGVGLFADNKYVGNTNYTTQPNFGRLALSTYAHYLFGHVAATAAITNDVPFMNAMLSKLPLNSTSAAYKYAATVDVSDSNTGFDWHNIGTASDADLARLLAGAILRKGLDSNGDVEYESTAILDIVQQVLGQDTSRAMDQDNNQPAPNVRQPLKFIPGDVIYVKITLTPPVVNVNLEQMTNPQQVASGDLSGKYSNVTYTIKITLTAPGGAEFETPAV